MERVERVPHENADGASDATTEETETACEAPALPSSVVLEERVNQKVAHYLMTLKADDLKKYNPPSKHHCKTEDDFKAALNKLHVFLHACVGKEDGAQRTYRYARGKDFGRMFCFEGLQNVWRAFRGALCKESMTDIDMKNCHPVILLWLCKTYNINCPKLREYVKDRERHLTELGKVLRGKDREHCKRLFLIATNTNQKIGNVSYPFFDEYQAEIQDVIQPALMKKNELAARFKPHAEQAAGQREADGREANEEGSFLNLVLCYSENKFLQTVRTYLEGKGIEIAVLMLDGLMVYGDHYDNAPLLEELHTLLKDKYGIEMHFDFKQHETTVLDDMPKDFDETVVLGDEWHKRHTSGDKSWSTGFLFNIKDAHLHDATDRARLLAACHGQGAAADGKPFTWKCAARKLWLRGGLEEDGFEQAWAEAKEAPHHDGSTLRHYSRRSDEEGHIKICKHALGLVGRTSFKETELRDYFLLAVGDDVFCLEKRSSFLVWNDGRWIEDAGAAVLAHTLMDLAQSLFQSNKSVFDTKLSKLVAKGQGDGDEAEKLREEVIAISRTANAYGNQRNQNVLALIKNLLRAHARRDDPFDSQPFVFAFTNRAYDLTRERGDDGWFAPDKYDYLLMSCQKPWREPTTAEMTKVASWFESIFPDPDLRRAYISILKSGCSGKRFEYFFVATGDGCNGKGLLNEHFIYLLGLDGYAAIGHLDLLTKPIKSGANSEARSLHKKRFVRYSEPNPGEKMEAVRLSNVNELTGNEQLKARTLHEKDDDTRLHATSLLECNEPPHCVGDKGNSSQRRWRFIPFVTKFTDDAAELRSDPAKFRPKDETLKDDDAKKQHYCAFFKYLITAENVWAPSHCLDDSMPEVTKRLAKEYLAKNDELSTWFLEEFEEDTEVDAAGFIVNFVSLKDVKELYVSQPIFTSMRKEDQRKFSTKKLKEDFEKNILLRKFFKPAMKVKLASRARS